MKDIKHMLNLLYGEHKVKSFNLLLIKNKLIHFLKCKMREEEEFVYIDTDSMKGEKI